MADSQFAEKLDAEALAGLKKQLLEASKKLELKQLEQQREGARARIDIEQDGEAADDAEGVPNLGRTRARRGPAMRRTFRPRDFRTDAFSTLEKVQIGEDNTLLDTLQKVEVRGGRRPPALAGC